MSYDLEGLPQEILDQLKLDNTRQKQEGTMQIAEICKSGPKDVNEIIIEMFRRHQLMLTRAYVQNKLHRMTKSGMLKFDNGAYSVVE